MSSFTISYTKHPLTVILYNYMMACFASLNSVPNVALILYLANLKFGNVTLDQFNKSLDNVK